MAQPSLDKPKTQLFRHACETANGLVEEKNEEKEGAASTELPADSAGLIQRRLTPMTSMLMHRTIESLNIGRLALHLNPSSATAKNSTFGGSKTAPLESLRTRKEPQYVETPYEKKKRAPRRIYVET